MLLSCRICSFATGIKSLLFGKNFHSLILTEKEKFISGNTNLFTLLIGRTEYYIFICLERMIKRLPAVSLHRKKIPAAANRAAAIKSHTFSV